MPASEFRAEVNALIERLIDLCDRFDGDENLEDTGDAEPCLGSNEAHHGGTAWLAFGGGDDREHDAGDDGEAGADDDIGLEDHDPANGVRAL